MASRVPPPPPRIMASPNTDPNLIALVQWFDDFYKAAVIEGFFLNVVSEGEENPVTPGDLPDPASTTLATAQKTANDAYLLAQAAQSTANSANNRTKDWKRGTVDITGAVSTGEITFSPAQADTDYQVFIQVKSTSGAPPLDATLVIAKTYAVDKCTFTVNAQPGVGKTVTFDWVMIRGF